MSKPIRLLTLALLVAAIAVPASAAALAVFVTGDYGGSTSQKNGQGKGRKFSLHAAMPDQISNLRFNETGKCDDGGGSRGSQGPLSATVAADGTFAINESSPSGATTVKLNGTIAGASASGTLKVTSRFDAAGNPTKNGQYRCSTGTVKWSAKTPAK